MDERDFLATYDATAFDRPSVTVDVVLLSISSQARLQTLLVRRTEHPYKGSLALPGGFVAITESLEAAARRVLRDKAGAKNVFLEQLYTFGDPKRDPRTRVITVAYYALVPASVMEQALGSASDAGHSAACATVQVPWLGETGGPVQALDEAGNRMRLAFHRHRNCGSTHKG
jgi:8-oxo-dGTP diphosphatase